MAKQDKPEKQHNLAGMFKALGDPMRLRVFLFLRARSGDTGADPTVTEVSRSVAGSKKIPSKVSRALKELRVAGLVTIERQGKSILCGVHRDAVAALAQCFGALPDLPASVPILPEEEVNVPAVKNGATAPTPRTGARRKTRVPKETNHALSQDPTDDLASAARPHRNHSEPADADPALELVVGAK